MKTWSTYTVAFILGLATCLLFNPMAGVLDIFKEITSYLLSLSVFIFSPLVLFSFTSGIASLGKDKLGGRFSDRFVTWTLLTSILLPLFAGICFLIFPVAFPIIFILDPFLFLQFIHHIYRISGEKSPQIIHGSIHEPLPALL